MIWSMRSSSAMTSLKSSRRGSPSSIFDWTNCTVVRMPVSGFRISWATEAESSPREISRSRSACISSVSSAASVKVAAEPITSPLSPRRGNVRERKMTRFPSLTRRTRWNSSVATRSGS